MEFLVSIIGLIVMVVVMFIVAVILHRIITKPCGEIAKEAHKVRFSEFEEMLKDKNFNTSKRIVVIDGIDGDKWMEPYFRGLNKLINKTGIWFDYENKKIAVLSRDNSEIIFSFNEVLKYEFDGIENTKVVGSQVVETISNYTLRIVIKTTAGAKSTDICFNPVKLNKKSTEFIFFDSLMKRITDELDNIITSEPTQDNETADDITKYKALLDSGVITQQDFDTKKKQLLEL